MRFRNVNRTLIADDEEAEKRVSELKEGEVISFSEVNKNPGTVNMLKTWRGWMKETATAMNHYGCSMPMYIDSKGLPHGKRPYNEGDAHEQFTSLYLGVDENGKRKSWVMSKNGDEIQASIGDRLWAMDRHLEWCTERAIKLTIPKKSEYMKLKQEANA